MLSPLNASTTALPLECLDDRSQSFVVGVDVAQNAETHGGRRCGG
jgi:hypothetical protein